MNLKQIIGGGILDEVNIAAKNANTAIEKCQKGGLDLTP